MILIDALAMATIVGASANPDLLKSGGIYDGAGCVTNPFLFWERHAFLRPRTVDQIIVQHFYEGEGAPFEQGPFTFLDVMAHNVQRSTAYSPPFKDLVDASWFVFQLNVRG